MITNMLNKTHMRTSMIFLTLPFSSLINLYIDLWRKWMQCKQIIIRVWKVVWYNTCLYYQTSHIHLQILQCMSLTSKGWELQRAVKMTKWFVIRDSCASETKTRLENKSTIRCAHASTRKSFIVLLFIFGYFFIV